MQPTRQERANERTYERTELRRLALDREEGSRDEGSGAGEARKNAIVVVLTNYNKFSMRPYHIRLDVRKGSSSSPATSKFP